MMKRKSLNIGIWVKKVTRYVAEFWNEETPVYCQILLKKKNKKFWGSILEFTRVIFVFEYILYIYSILNGSSQQKIGLYFCIGKLVERSRE